MKTAFVHYNLQFITIYIFETQEKNCDENFNNNLTKIRII